MVSDFYGLVWRFLVEICVVAISILMMSIGHCPTNEHLFDLETLTNPFLLHLPHPNSSMVAYHRLHHFISSSRLLNVLVRAADGRPEEGARV